MHRSTSGRNRDRGTTIVELLVALLLFAVGVASLAGGMRTALRSSAHGRAVSLGAYAAEARLERLRARCAASPGSASFGPVAEHWSIGAPAGPLLPSTEVVDTLTILTSSHAASRVVRSIVRCVP